MGWTRRNWMLLAVAAAARKAAAAGSAPLSLGFSLYGMKDFRLGDAVELCSRLGYSGVELALMEGYPAEPRRLTPGDRSQLRYQFSDLDLELSGMMERILLTADEAQHFENLEKIKRAAELARDVDPHLAPDGLPVLETVLGGRPGEWERLRAPMAERLDGWRRVAEEHQIAIALKPHVRSAVRRPEQALWLLDQVRSRCIRLAFDYSHYRLQNLSMEAVLDQLADKLIFVHVKDVAGEQDSPQFLLPGQGDVDYARLFALLIERGYAGPVVVEVSAQLSSRDDYHAFEAAESSLEVLEAALEEALGRSG